MSSQSRYFYFGFHCFIFVAKKDFSSYLSVMSAADNKLHLVQMIIESEDKTFVAKLLEYARSLKIQKANIEEDITDYVLKEVQLAMEELDNGSDPGTPHEEMLEQFRKEFPGLTI